LDPSSGLLPPIPSPPACPSLAWRWLCIVGVLAVEILALTLGFDTQFLSNSHLLLGIWLGHASALLKIGLAAAAAFALIIAVDRHTLPDLRQQALRYTWKPWLGAHIGAVAVLTLCSSVIFTGDLASTRHASWWLHCWVACGIVALALGLLAVAPLRFWRQLLQQRFAALLIATLCGVGAWGSGQITQEFWRPLAGATFWLSHALLALIYTDVVALLPEHELGTASFQVIIDPACSGYEGIGLVSLLLTLYLWLFRTHLRFPRVFLLLPFGMLAIWLANVIRITALIVIGTSLSPEIAVGGFHSQSGWIAFLTIGLGVIFLAHRGQLFTTEPKSFVASEASSLAPALLVPLLTMMAITIVTSAFSSGFDWLYPIRVAVTGGILWYFRAVYKRFEWTWSWYAVGMGIGIFVLWLFLNPAVDSTQTAVAHGLASLSSVQAILWVVCRVLGSTLIVPIVEELAFRGYVMQKLAAQDFESVRPGQFTWFAFFLSSLLFGALHGRWFAGTLAGMGYALILARRGQLADAVVAHMTTNGLIAAYVLTQKEWSLWA
jgi:exosortase E/protease (VPEID-CTERM system)